MKRFNKHLNPNLTPFVPKDFYHVYHQFTLRIENHRDSLYQELKNNNIASGIYYPTPVHQLPSFNSFEKLPETEKAAHQVLSIPVHPSLTKRNVKQIIDTINQIMDKYQK
jgi:perosamine synthetase